MSLRNPYTMYPVASGPDTEDPTEPGNLAANSITQTGFGITWDASTDNVGVVGYEIYLDAAYQDTVTDLFYTFSGLTADTSYNVTVIAIDAASNVSTGATLNVHTLLPKTVLIVVADAGTLGADDVELGAIMTGLGWTVTFVSDETAENTTGYSVVFISSSIVVGTLATKYRTATKGVCLLDPGVPDNLSFSSADAGSASALANISIIENTHPITSGFSLGSLTVLDTTRQMRIIAKTALGAGALVLAEQPSVSTQAMLLCYDDGDLMDGGFAAPARRVYSPLHTYSADLLPDGQTIFIERVLNWLAYFI